MTPYSQDPTRKETESSSYRLDPSSKLKKFFPNKLLNISSEWLWETFFLLMVWPGFSLAMMFPAILISSQGNPHRFKLEGCSHPYVQSDTRSHLVSLQDFLPPTSSPKWSGKPTKPILLLFSSHFSYPQSHQLFRYKTATPYKGPTFKLWCCASPSILRSPCKLPPFCQDDYGCKRQKSHSKKFW